MCYVAGLLPSWHNLRIIYVNCTLSSWSFHFLFPIQNLFLIAWVSVTTILIYMGMILIFVPYANVGRCTRTVGFTSFSKFPTSNRNVIITFRSLNRHNGNSSSASISPNVPIRVRINSDISVRYLLQDFLIKRISRHFRKYNLAILMMFWSFRWINWVGQKLTNFYFTSLPLPEWLAHISSNSAFL